MTAAALRVLNLFPIEACEAAIAATRVERWRKKTWPRWRKVRSRSLTTRNR